MMSCLLVLDSVFELLFFKIEKFFKLKWQIGIAILCATEQAL